MKQKIFYLAMMCLLITAALFLWAYAPDLAAAVGCKCAWLDIMSAVILASAFVPSGKFCNSFNEPEI